jgi:hypothetical protein
MFTGIFRLFRRKIDNAVSNFEKSPARLSNFSKKPDEVAGLSGIVRLRPEVF